MEVWLRTIGIALNVAGAMLLAWRVKGLLSILVSAQEANDLNFRLVIDILHGTPQSVPIVVGMGEQAVRREKTSIWLLVAGFICIAVGNALVGLSTFM